MKAEHRRISEQIGELKKRLEPLPQDNFYVTRNHTRYKWFASTQETMRYLPKSRRQEAEQLALHKYLSCLLSELLQEKAAIESYLQKYEQIKCNSEKILEHPGYQELLHDEFQSRSSKLQEWIDETYEQNPNYPDNLKQISRDGKCFRSKSEVLIHMVLLEYEIPHRYECLLQLGNYSYYPDFTIMDPTNSKVWYWEHFGMVDHVDYWENMLHKLRIYHKEGVIPGKNLIVSYETTDQPFTIYQVEKLVEQFFPRAAKNGQVRVSE